MGLSASAHGICRSRNHQQEGHLLSREFSTLGYTISIERTQELENGDGFTINNDIADAVFENLSDIDHEGIVDDRAHELGGAIDETLHLVIREMLDAGCQEHAKLMDGRTPAAWYGIPNDQGLELVITDEDTSALRLLVLAATEVPEVRAATGIAGGGIHLSFDA
ncbi:hypothetical protein ACFVAJ_17095 [Agromyces sp. NPDC057679]|uniref:hypothetical protein n=1 Tax=Agromyces sp. NPDC057679 TaxID=3346207 RepID=UPI00366ADADB